MTEKDRKILVSIWEHCVAILGYEHLSGHLAGSLGAPDDEELFSSMCYDGLLMRLGQIGEKANRLSEGFRDDTSGEIPWSKTIGMRNILIHRYDDVDRGIVDRVVASDLVALLDFCAKELGLEEPSPERGSPGR